MSLGFIAAAILHVATAVRFVRWRVIAVGLRAQHCNNKLRLLRHLTIQRQQSVSMVKRRAYLHDAMRCVQCRTSYRHQLTEI